LEKKTLKVLLITGLMAKENVERCSKESHVQTKVMALKVPVAAFLTLKLIIEALKSVNLKQYDLVLVPGLIRGDTKVISNEIGVPTFKGPIYCADLPAVLDSLCDVKLSTIIPSDELLREKLRDKALAELVKVEANRDALLKKPGNILIGNLPVGKDFPMRVIGEIVDAALLSDEEIGHLSKRYVADGADLVDLGMIAGESRPKDARRVIAAARKAVKVPVSIDSLDPNEIEAAVSAGADLILSLDEGNIKAIGPLPSNIAVVVIPTNQREGYFPKKTEERVRLLEGIIAEVKSLGIKKILGDLILDPMDVSGSFFAFHQFTQRNPEVPLFVGVSNVTELIDADSVGVNALLARLSSEVGASMLLATQKSDKAQGSIKEEATAAKMMFLAKHRGSVPKNLGIDLLILKDKRKHEETYTSKVEKTNRVLVASGTKKPAELDEQGGFRVFVDRAMQNIVVTHFVSTISEKSDLTVIGKTADVIYSKIIELGLVSFLDHAAYLGGELAKAEIALRTGKEYIQDQPMFKKQGLA
jgi:dihydropteroate synthase-like protein